MTGTELKTKYARLLGEFIGTIEGIFWWDIPDELKEKLSRKLKELEDQAEDLTNADDK